jgi:hypothetical protein
MIGAVLAVLLCSACSAAGDRSISTKMEGGEVRVIVRHVRNAENLNIRGVAVYGEVIVKSDWRLRSVDLGCIFLLADGTRSLKPYVDSVAHVMTNSYPADKDGIVRAKLYWVFPGRDITEVEPNSLMLTFDQSHDPCLKRETAPLAGKEQ